MPGSRSQCQHQTQPVFQVVKPCRWNVPYERVQALPVERDEQCHVDHAIVIEPASLLKEVDCPLALREVPG